MDAGLLPPTYAPPTPPPPQPTHQPHTCTHQNLCTKALLEAGAAVDVRRDNESTPLILASWWVGGWVGGSCRRLLHCRNWQRQQQQLWQKLWGWRQQRGQQPPRSACLDLLALRLLSAPSSTTPAAPQQYHT